MNSQNLIRLTLLHKRMGGIAHTHNRTHYKKGCGFSGLTKRESSTTNLKRLKRSCLDPNWFSLPIPVKLNEIKLIYLKDIQKDKPLNKTILCP